MNPNGSSPTLVGELVDTSQRVGEHAARRTKIAHIAQFLRRLSPAEIEIGVSRLAGIPRQARSGIGYALIRDARPATNAGQSSLGLIEVDATFEQIAQLSGRGSLAARVDLLSGPVFEGDGERAGIPRAAAARRAAAGRARRPDDRSRRERRGSPGGRRAPCRDGRRRHRCRRGAALTKARRAARFLDHAVPAARADARATCGRHRGCDGSHPVAVARMEARRRARAGPQVRRRGAHLHAHRQRRHAAAPEIVDAVRSASARTPDPRWRGDRAEGRTARPIRSRTRCAASAARSTSSACGEHAAFGVLLRLPASRRRGSRRRCGVRAFDSLTAVCLPMRIPRLVTGDVAAAQAFYDDARARQHEGVMVKALDAPYEPGSRSAAWLKVKRAIRSTSSCSPRSGDTAAGTDGCRTFISARAILRAGSSSCSARPSRA